MAIQNDPIRIEGFHLGPFQTNCYIVHAPDDPGCWIIDAGDAPGPLIDRVRALQLEPRGVLLTHAHADHILGLPVVRDAFPDIPVHLHDAERDWLGDPRLNLSAGFGAPFTTRGPDERLDHGQTIPIGEARLEVRHIPGHSPGSVAFVCEPAGVAIVGDTLFAGSIGRTDFPTSDHDALLRGIREHLYTLDDAVVAHPGHGPQTTIGVERRSNPFVRADG